jgi:anti-sigma regulatory factor (Ser/Thr protein kinase)
MPTVELAFSPAPEYVRTARLVGVAVARRAGVPDDLLDDVRLAIGEACGRAVARHQRHHLTTPVRVEMSDDGPYIVRVIDAAGPTGRDPDTDQEVMAGALLAAVVKDLDMRTGPDGTVVRMAWPVRRRLTGTPR